MKASVIIPTYNRPRTLLQALSSLQEQTCSDFEVLVVDNAVDPNIEQMVSEFNCGARVPACYIKEPTLGTHYARHTGARSANGHLLIFTDDDATFDPGWVQTYAHAFEQYPEMAAAGGPTLPAWEAPPPKWLLEFMGAPEEFPILSLMDRNEGFSLKPGGVFFSVNMAIRRNVLFELGGFNPDCFGDIWLGDGDAGLNRKIWERGMPVGYVPGAVVYHHIPQNRMTAEYFCHRLANEGACAEYAALRARKTGAGDFIARVFFILLSLTRLALVTPVRFLRRDRFAALKVRMGLSYNLSRLRYIFRLLNDRQLRELVARVNWL